MSLIQPMLSSRLENAARLTDPRYIAEPKLDGEHAQLHVYQGRTEPPVQPGRVGTCSGIVSVCPW
jgi:hypothetical protein